MNFHEYYQQQKIAEQKVQQYYQEARQAQAVKAAQVRPYAAMRKAIAQVMYRVADWIAADKRSAEPEPSSGIPFKEG